MVPELSLFSTTVKNYIQTKNRKIQCYIQHQDDYVHGIIFKSCLAFHPEAMGQEIGNEYMSFMIFILTSCYESNMTHLLF